MGQKLNQQSKGLLFGLAVQFLLGMAVNLYVAFPEGVDAHQNFEFATHNFLAVAHMLWGTLLVIGSITFLVRSFKAQTTAWRTPAIMGLISILVAWGAGDAFVATQNDTWSYLMSVGFIVAILSYAWGIAQANRIK
jgi:hypothetical protein